MKRWVGLVQALESLSFLVMVLLHSGVRVPLGFATLRDAALPGAVPFETLCSGFLAVAAYAALAERPWAWKATVTAQSVSLFFVLVGLYFVGAGRAPASALNAAYHEVMAGALVLGLVLMLVPGVNRPLRS